MGDLGNQRRHSHQRRAEHGILADEVIGGSRVINARRIFEKIKAIVFFLVVAIACIKLLGATLQTYGHHSEIQAQWD